MLPYDSSKTFHPLMFSNFSNGYALSGQAICKALSHLLQFSQKVLNNEEAQNGFPCFILLKVFFPTFLATSGKKKEKNKEQWNVTKIKIPFNNIGNENKNCFK